MDGHKEITYKVDRMDDSYLRRLPPELRLLLRPYLLSAISSENGGSQPVVYFRLHKKTHVDDVAVPLHARMLPHFLWFCFVCHGVGTECRCTLDRVINWLLKIN